VNQCVFFREFRVARSFWRLPKHLKGAAGLSPDPGGHDSDCDPNTELVSTPNTKVKDSVQLFSAFPNVSKYRDPLRLIRDYIYEVSTAGLMVASSLLSAISLISTETTI
jgi:hypothetical protein